ncbi:diguanylate cyclase [Rhodoferax sp. TH121]|uniref:diguanylate cyclase domain-containing protein n=1 Tax=Rhodoferax sp. TH121 TaxID=2022803 RepID=UPI0020CDFC12|nr:diguanylate cyclase [Rhodoferax sp. TH121]
MVILNSQQDHETHASAWVETVMQKIIDSLARPYQLSDITHICTTSVGATIYTGQPCSAGDLLRQADQAMYDAKIAGKNRYRLFAYGTVSTL